jgi:oligopeptide/dipeptide ABC transporter ATP-binding protein
MYAGHIVESAAVDELFDSPKNPYTEALLRSSARRGLRGRELPTIRGSIPRPGAFPAGCRFVPRCDYAQDACRFSVPPLEQLAGNRVVRCIRHDELQLRGVQ